MRNQFFNFLKRGPTSAFGSPTEEQIEVARALHKQGKYDDAAELYRKLLAGPAASSELYYRYGNLLKDQGALEDALVHYDKAIALNADHAHAYCNRAVVFGLVNKLADALDSYDRAIAIDSTDAIAQCNRAILLLGLGKKDAALLGFETAIAHDTTNHLAHFYRGALLQERKLWPASLAAYKQAIAINPNDAVALHNQGVVFKELGQWTLALNSFSRAIELKPDFVLAYSNRGQVLEQLMQLPAAHSDYGQALKLYDHAIALGTNDASIYMKRAVLLQKLGRYADALDGYNAAAALDANDAEIWFNRGTVLSELDDLQSALESYDRAIAVRPRHEGAFLNRGVALQALGRLEDAIASYQLAIEIDPGLPESKYNFALASLAHGDYTTGWSAYEWRWRAKSGPIFREKRNFREPLWLGIEPLKGKTILLYAEQGLGDALQFCRYVELVASLAAHVVLEVPRPLVELCAGVRGASQVVSFGSPLPTFEFQIPLMSLPLAFGTTLKNIPSANGYLECDHDKVAFWQQRLGAKKRPRIGLTWSGNRSAGTDRERHFALSKLTPYLGGDFQFFCLQTDIAAADRATLDATSGILQFSDAELTFASTAALCECMDLVVSIDTSIAHLSGALGKSTWVLLPFVADWRWLTGREDSPWYRSVRLFRQRNHGNWDEVFERLSTELRSHFTKAG